MKKKKANTPKPDPNGMTVDAIAKLLSTVTGQGITVQMIRSDLDEGAPANGDGTVNLIRYGAWLAYHVK
jgi:hypothetical protein